MSWDLTNEGLDFTPQQVSLDALLSGQTPPKNQKFFKKKGEALAEANRDLQSTPTTAFSVSPSTLDSVTPGTPAVNAPAPGAAGPTAVQPADEVPPDLHFSGGEPQITTTSQAEALPKLIHPTAAEADKDVIGSPRLTKLGTFLSLLKTAAQGAAAGEASIQQTARGAVSNPGAGFLAAQEVPLEQQKQVQGAEAGELGLQRERTQNNLLPYTLAMQQRVAQLEAGKVGAETNKANAEAAAARGKTQLDFAESLTKPYIKGEDGLIYQATPDGKGGTSLSRVEGTGALATIPDETLQAAGLDQFVGKKTQFPLKTATEIQRIADDGNTIISAGGRMVEVNKRTHAVVHDYGQATPIVAINAQQGAFGAGGPGGGTPGNPNLTGDEFLRTLPPKMANALREVGEYSADPNRILGRANPETRTNFFSQLKQAYPDWSEANYAAFNKTASDYAPGGAIGQQAINFNTAIRHLGGIANEAGKLDNTKFQDWNNLKNWAKQKFGNADVTNFDTFKTFLGGELGKLLGGGIATDSSRAEANGIMSRVQAPAQLQGAFKTAVSLMRGKISALEAAYGQQIPGRTKKLIDPGAQAVLNQLGLQNEGTDQRQPQTTTPNQFGFVPFKR